MKRVVALLIALSLIAGMAGCQADPGPEPPIQYDLTVSSSWGGSVITPGEATFTYEAGTAVELAVVPDDCYRFVNWTGDNVVNPDSATTTITMDAAKSVTANFALLRYDLTVTGTDGGSVISPGEGTFNYDCNTLVALVAQAEDGYQFVNWTGDVDTVADVNAASTTVVVDYSYSIAARFERADAYFDQIGPGPWGLFVVGGGVEARVTEEGIAVRITSDAVGVGERMTFGAWGGSYYTAEGDFDIRMDYELITWPKQSGVRLAVQLRIPGNPIGINLERVGFGDPDVDFAREPREVYLVVHGGVVTVIRGTNDMSGTLRICRDGSTIRCYYATQDGWYQIYETEWSTGGTRVYIGTWSHDDLFGGQEVSVVLRTAEILGP